MKEKKRLGIGSSSSAEPVRILVVEDEAIIAMDLASILSRRGFIVIGPAATGEDSIARAETEQPDLVFMDIRLRGPMSGLEAAREIKSRWGIPVVFLTAYGEEPLAGRIAQGNGTPRVIKPFDESDIAIILSRYLPRHNN